MERGWEKVRSVSEITVWKSGEEGIGVALLSTQHLPKQQLGIDESAETLVILVEDDMEAWEGFLVQIAGRAFLDDAGDVVFVPSGLYPSSIPSGEYEYTVGGLRNGSKVVVKNLTAGVTSLENGTRAVFPVENASPYDVLMIKYEGSYHRVQIMPSENSTAQTGTGMEGAHP